jgi:hypothetical protein
MQDSEAVDEADEARRRQGPLRHARQALGPARTRAAEERGTAMETPDITFCRHEVKSDSRKAWLGG